VILCLAACALAPAQAPPTQPQDLALETLRIVAEKCTQCHGPRVASPKAHFGYVTDLSRLVDSGKVVPGDLQRSKLFGLVKSHVMPPSIAANGTLSDDQIETIRQWILAGAPAPQGPAAAAILSQSPAGPAATTPAPTSEVSFLDRLAAFLGRYHVITIHFPIALLLAAGLAELLFMRWPARLPAVVARYCLLLGTAGAIVAASLGWLLAGSLAWAPEDRETLEVHRWFGTAAAACAFLATVMQLLAGPAGDTVRRTAYRCLLLMAVAAVVVAGYYGGVLVYTDDFFQW
jgi:mono/diheme cytochrome c family protein/uncharacterized membrane protein